MPTQPVDPNSSKTTIQPSVSQDANASESNQSVTAITDTESKIPSSSSEGVLKVEGEKTPVDKKKVTLAGIENTISKILENRETIKKEKDFIKELMPIALIKKIIAGSKNNKDDEITSTRTRKSGLINRIKLTTKLVFFPLFLIPACVRLSYLLLKNDISCANLKMPLHTLTMEFINEEVGKNKNSVLKINEEDTNKNDLEKKVLKVCRGISEVYRKEDISELKKCNDNKRLLSDLFLAILEEIHDTTEEQSNNQSLDEKRDKINKFINDSKRSICNPDGKKEEENISEDIKKYRTAFNLALQQHVEKLQVSLAKLEKRVSQ